MTENDFTAKKAKAIYKIKQLLEDKDLVEFKIGKTDNPEEREKAHKVEGYTKLISLVQLNSIENMDRMEKELISFFKHNPKCGNKNDGGGGNFSDDNYCVYVITK